MHVQMRYSPQGTLIIEVDAQCSKCNHTHITEQSQWDEVITATSGWLAQNSPVCRDFPGILPWARGDSPTSRLSSWDKSPPAMLLHSNTGDGSVGSAPAGPSSTPGSTPPGATPGGPPPNSSLVMRQPKPIRSVFGCTTCKKRKVKCDEKRPKCGNCAKKSARECVYLYDVAAWNPNDAPAPATAPAPPAPPKQEPLPPVSAPTDNRSSMVSMPSVNGLQSVPMPATQQHIVAAAIVSPPVAPVTNNPPATLVSGAVPPLRGVNSVPQARRDPGLRLPRTEPQLAPQVPNGVSLNPSSTIAQNVNRVSLSPARDGSKLRPKPSSLALLPIPPPKRPSRETVARHLEAHGMTWFIEASEVVDAEKYSSQQKRTYSERKQNILASCWDTYLGYQGQLPLDLSEVPDLNSLVDAGLLYGFVSVGAMYCAYWSRYRRMPSEEHYVGAFAFGPIAIEAARRIVDMANFHKHPNPQLETKLFTIVWLFMSFACPAASTIAWEGVYLLAHFARQYNGTENLVRHLEQDAITAPCTVEMVSIVVVDLYNALLRGTDLNMGHAECFDWMDDHPIAVRVIPEGFGISVQMCKYALQTVAVLYGRLSAETVSPPLKDLYRTLSNDALVHIYSSPQPPRVQFGDMLMRQALFCLIFIDGFQLRPDDAQVKRASDTILELYSEALCNGVYIVRWLTPMLIGSCLCVPERRQAYLDIYETMEATCGCDDIGATRRITQEVWERRDAGREDCSWRDIFKDVKETDLVFV